jgi:DNA-binding response OmpR family regulator
MQRGPIRPTPQARLGLSFHMMRILVAEDDERLADLISERLNDARYTVDVAADGDEALAFSATSTYDVMLLDIMLPRIDGLDVCRQRRALGDRTPILILTARDGVADRVTGLDSGADDYLTKPFAFDELLARIRALLRRDAERKEPILREGDLTLDPAARRVRWGTRDLDLTDREYRVLEVLLRRAGQLVPREVVVDNVWGFEYPDTSNLLDVYLGRLRRKLGACGAPPMIHSVRRAGIRLNCER